LRSGDTSIVSNDRPDAYFNSATNPACSKWRSPVNASVMPWRSMAIAVSLCEEVLSVTTLLQQAFAEAAKLSESEQHVLASRLLAELAAEDEFDRAIAGSSDKLAALARAALAEHRAGQTEDLDPERL
jgi:hypothetical protein